MQTQRYKTAWKIEITPASNNQVRVALMAKGLIGKGVDVGFERALALAEQAWKDKAKLHKIHMCQLRKVLW